MVFDFSFNTSSNEMGYLTLISSNTFRNNNFDYIKTISKNEYNYPRKHLYLKKS